MSVIETAYVEVLPNTDGFEAKLVADTSRAAKAAGAAVSAAMGGGPNGPNDPFEGLRKNAAAAQATLEKTAGDAQRLNAQYLIGAASEAEATAAARAYALAGVAAAKANVELAVATGIAADAADIHILALQKEGLAAEQTAARSRRATGTLRENLRKIASGEASVSSLGIGGVARLGIGGLAIGAAFQGLQHLGDALRVSGDEAYTTEGKLRNLGAALSSGDIVGGLMAIAATAPTVTERLDAMKKSAETTPVDFRNISQEATHTAGKLEKVVAAQEALGDTGGLHDALKQGAEDLRDAAAEATALANALETSVTAANDVGAAIAAAGSEAAAFGEANRIGGQGARPGQGQRNTVDSTATDSTANAEARSRAARTKGLQDDLAQAKVEAAQAARLEKNQRDIVEGRAARHQATVEAETRVVQIQNQIDDDAARAREDAARKREADAKAAADAARKRAEAERREAEQAARAYRQGLSDRELLLQLGAKRAELTEKDLSDDRRAARKLIKFYEAESRDVKLTVAERRQYALDAIDERLALRDIGKKAKEQGASFSISDLYQSAVDQFRTYGSNIGGRDAILSPQDARGDLGRNILVQLQSRTATASERQVALLVSIDQKLDRRDVSPARRAALETKRYGVIEGLRGAAMAAHYGYGVN